MTSLDISSFFAQHPFYGYLFAVSVVGVGAMSLDKFSAQIDFDRISERDLAIISFAGGFLGIIVGGLLAHHKTSKPEFWVPVGIAAVIWGVALVYYLPYLLAL
ncbi:MAG: DUF1294 domain-containing protein [Nitrososphaerales archaeon]